MALGRTAKLFVFPGEFDITGSPVYDDTTLGTALHKSLGQNLQVGANALGDTIAAGKWYEICRVNMSVSASRGTVDTSDSCSGPFGSSVPGPPDSGLTFSAFKKVGTARTVWQTLLFNRWDNAEIGGDPGHVTVMMLDTVPLVNDPPGTGVGAEPLFANGVGNARGVVMVAKVFNADESHQFAGGIDLSFTLRPSGASQHSTPMRRFLFPASASWT